MTDPKFDDGFMTGAWCVGLVLVAAFFVVWGLLAWQAAGLTIIAIGATLLYRWYMTPIEKAKRARDKRIEDRVCELMARGYTHDHAAQMAEAELQKEAKDSTDEMKKAGAER